MTDFISLQCPNCAAKLDIYGDMERFACGYCKTEVIVQRRGGTVGLKIITDAIERVQEGTDRTAWELELARLTHESDELSAVLAQLGPAEEQPARTTGCGCALVVWIILGLFFIWAFSMSLSWRLFAVAASLTLIGAIVIGRMRHDIERAQPEKESKRLEERERVVDQLRLVDQRIATLKHWLKG